MGDDLGKLEEIFRRHTVCDFKWIDPGHIVVSQWVRMKCMFGCNEYGKNASCPPNVPSVSECREFFREYKRAALFHLEKQVGSQKELKTWIKSVHAYLLKIEREVFLSGYEKAFMLLIDNCCFCAECALEREECKNPKQSRPTVEALAVDVYQTARAAGYPLAVKSDPLQTMDRYALLLVE
jgi:predicted metal-binding protein